MKRLAPEAGYANNRKNMYRREVWNQLSRQRKPEAQVLLMPAQEMLEIEMAKSKGFCTSNMHVVDHNPAVVAHIKRRYPYVTTYGVSAGRACERMAKVGVQLDAANFDFCGCLGTPRLSELNRIYESGVLSEGCIVGVNMLRGRETKRLSHLWTVFNAEVRRFGLSMRQPQREFGGLINYVHCNPADAAQLSPTDKARLDIVLLALGLHGILRSGVYKSANGVQTMLWAVMYKAHKSSKPRDQYAKEVHKNRRGIMWPLIRDTLTGKKS